MDDFAPPRDAAIDELTQQSRTAVILALVGLGLQATGCCTSILGIGCGTALGAIGWFMARGILIHEPEGEARAYANVAWWCGSFSMIWGGLVTLAFATYLGLYVVGIAAILAAN